MASKYDDIPRYLRYKAGHERGEGCWDEEVERANKILHSRIVRMHRDKLCEGCARFDWLRTRFYTREIRLIDGTDKEAGQNGKIDTDRQVPTSPHHRNFENVRDDVTWSQYEAVAGARQEAKWLAKDPRFDWQLLNEQEPQCKLCKSLWNHAEGVLGLPTLRDKSNPKLLNIMLGGGPVFENGGKHRCIEGWPENDSDVRYATNGFTVTLEWETRSGHRYSYSFCIRPFVEDTPNRCNELPHCCLRLRRVDTMVNFDLVTRWLKLCDETHQHTTSSFNSTLALQDCRFIDTRNRCIVKQNDHVRYAALSYTWDQEEQCCLIRGNLKDLEEHGSLDRTKIALKKVIDDAIEACTKLEIPYLWVDALCIIQDDTQGKMYQIRNMDSIYSNAYVTIIAAAEIDARFNQRHVGRTVDLGLSRVSTPSTPVEPSFTIDGVSYSVDDNNMYEGLNRNFSTSKWSSRCWTFQELALSHRVLLFNAEEAVFYCSNGIACESVCLGDDSYRTLPPMRQVGLRHESSIEVCGFLHKLPRKNSTILDFIAQYEHVHLQLLNFYIGRSLSYETDVLNAFSGIINAQSESLGQFESGMPLRLFARALFLSIPLEAGPLSRRRGFPSWSWIGWKLEFSTSRTVLKNGSDPWGDLQRLGRLYWPLVQIYSCTGSGIPVLLLGPLDFDNGIEGYCTDSIELYNSLTPVPSLPTEPCVEGVPYLHESSDERAFPILIFWTHVARLNLWYSYKSMYRELHIDCPKIRARFEKHASLEEASLEFEVALIAMTGGLIRDFEAGVKEPIKPPWECKYGQDRLSGIVIERWRGLARRVGVVHGIDIDQWVAASPQKELLLLA